MADIIELILADHVRIRRLFAELGNAAGAAADADGRTVLHKLWEALAGLLELHADAEEEICYLPLFGMNAQAPQDLEDALADHGDVRDAVREAGLRTVGCPSWWRAVEAARTAALDHIGGREAEALSRFQRRASSALREELGRQWTAFVTARMLDAAGQ